MNEKEGKRGQGLSVRDGAETRRQIFPRTGRPGGSETSTDRGDIEGRMISNAVGTKRGFSETTRSASACRVVFLFFRLILRHLRGFAEQVLLRFE